MTAALDDRRVRTGAWITGTLFAYLIARNVLPNGLPVGVVLLGAVLGSATALTAMGLILVYRANRIVSFAHASFGGVGASLAVNLYLGRHVPYPISVAIGVLAGLVLGGLSERLIIRRFSSSSRLVLTVATIGLAQVLGAFELVVPKLVTGKASFIQSGFSTPLDVKLTVGTQIFNGNHLLIVLAVPAVVAGLGWFLLKTDAGIAVRGAAENPDRALLLGIPIRRLATIVWVLAGGLSALTAILQAPFLGLTPGVLSGPSLLLPALAVAVVARFESLPRAFVAGIFAGILDQAARWSTNYASVVNVVFLAVVLIALLLQRDKLSRAEDTGAALDVVGAARPVPRAIAALPEVRVIKRVLTIALLVIAVVVPFIVGDSRSLQLSITLVYALVAVSLVVLTGWAGTISLGQFALVGVGATVAGNLVTRWDLDLFTTLLLSGLGGAAVALALGLPALRIKGQFLAVTTLAFAVAMDTYVLNPTRFPWLVPQEVKRPILWGRFRLESYRPMYLLVLAVLVLSILAVQGLRRARTGRVLLATRDNERAAEAMAVATTRVKLTGFLLAGVICGVAGGLHVLLLHGARSGSYPPDQSLAVFSMAVIGGLGSIPGALVGVLLVRLTAQIAPELQLLLTGSGLLFLLLFLPGGLAQAMDRVRDRVLVVIARRNGLDPAGEGLDVGFGPGSEVEEETVDEIIEREDVLL